MLTPADFMHSRDPSDGSFLDEWHSSQPLGPEVLVRGSASGPSISDIERANVVLQNLTALEQRAIHLLEGFMKDAGTWETNAINCGVEAERMQCDFLLCFSFEATRDPWEYGYTYFNVGFVVHERTHHADQHGRPIKFVVSFH